MSRFVILTSMACALACGGTQQQRPTVGAPEVERAKPRLPPIPSDPLQLVPGDATELVYANLAALRDSEHFALVRGWAERLACQPHDDSHWLLDDSQRAIAARLPAKTRPTSRGVLIVEGDYEPDMPSVILKETEGLLPSAGARRIGPEQRRERGRFTVVERGDVAATLLGSQLLVIGDRAALEAVLDLADGKRTDKISDGPLFDALPTSEWIAEFPLVLLSRPSEPYGRRLRSELSSVGADGVLEGLSEPALIAGVQLDEGVSARLRARYRDQAAAADAAATAKQLFFQANLFMRLTGLPRIFDRAQAQPSGAQVDFALALTPDDVERLTSRVEWLLEAAADGGCQRPGAR